MRMKSEEHVQVVQVNSHEQCEYRAVKGHTKCKVKEKVVKQVEEVKAKLQSR